MSEFAYDNQNNIGKEVSTVNAFNRLRSLATTETASLRKYDCSIGDQDLYKLSLINKTGAGVVRTARFNDGAFMSFRIQEQDAIYQYDYSFYDHRPEPEIPTITKWRVVDYKGLTRSEYPKFLLSIYELSDDEVRLPSLGAVAILAAEAAEPNSWVNAYHPDEVVSTRKRMGTRRITKIAMNPELGEPYL